MSENLNSSSPAMTYDEWCDYAWVYWKARPEQREGQAYFNALYMVRPELANSVRAGYLDPFYRDEKLSEFSSYLLENW